MVFLIDGVNIAPFVEESGIKWTSNGLDGPKAGRNMLGDMNRYLVGYKARSDISCLWMTKDEANALYKVLMKEFFTVTTDTIPWENGTVTKRMYSNNAAITMCEEYTDGTKIYADLSFPLIER